MTVTTATLRMHFVQWKTDCTLEKVSCAEPRPVFSIQRKSVTSVFKQNAKPQTAPIFSVWMVISQGSWHLYVSHCQVCECVDYVHF